MSDELSHFSDTAYSIPLTPDQLILLGEITAIAGQIDELMVRAVQRLLGITRPTANTIMGAARTATNAGIWAALIREKCSHECVLSMLSTAEKELQVFSADRNDFVHAYFLFGRIEGGLMSEKPYGRFFAFEASEPRVAMRVRNEKRRSPDDLVPVRARAAELSRLIAHLNSVACNNQNYASPSPWLDKLAPRHRPHTDSPTPQ